MSERYELMIPGPTHVDPAVMRAMARTVESHMSAAFGEKYKRTLEKLKILFATKGEAFAMAGTGTLAQEIGLANIIRPGDRVLNLVTGFFSNRFVDITQRLGGMAHPLRCDLGNAIKPQDVAGELSRGRFQAVTCAHVETSTGVAIPLKEIGEVVKASGAKFIVDTVASLGGMEVKTDEWGIDVSCSCSQKCLAVPPGLALLAVSREALEEVERRKDTVPTLYGDLRGWLSLVRDPAKNYYSTQPVNLIYALEEALDQLLSEGLERRIRRHRIVAEAFRSSMIAIGLKLVAESGYAADTVTSVFYPEGVDDASFRGELARSNVFIARGFGELEGKMFRIGHMGLVNANDVMATVAAIERGMKKLGHRFDYGAGCKAAQMWLEKL